MRAVRRHWMLAALLAAGLALRVLAQLAYRPALLYIDSDKYLSRSYGADPVGYRVMLRPLQWAGGLGLVTAVQHVLGLAMAAALYAVLRRRGAYRWVAALAVAPIVLDAYQLQAEQTIMPDILFEALIVAGVVVLIWRPRPGPWIVVLGGLALGAATDVRQIGEVLVIPAVVFVFLATGGWRRGLVYGALMAASFAIPMLAYMTASDVVTGHFGMTRRGVDILYGRSAFAADCGTLRLPSYERALCPSRPVAAALGIDGIINSRDGPLKTYKPPAGRSMRSIKTHFELSVLRQQPLAVPRSVARDLVKIFAITRGQTPGDRPISRWQFQESYPTYPPGITTQYVAQVGPHEKAPAVIRPLAAILRGYQLHGGYTPGPLFAVSGLLGLIGTFAALIRRRTDRALASACALATLTAGTVLVFADLFEFSWRYQLPGIALLPAAGALGIAVIGGRLADVRSAVKIIRRRRRGGSAAAKPPPGQLAQPPGTRSPSAAEVSLPAEPAQPGRQPSPASQRGLGCAS
jgi:hypothetical protein